MLKYFEKADIDINANPPPNILAERWGIRIYIYIVVIKSWFHIGQLNKSPQPCSPHLITIHACLHFQKHPS